MISKAKEETMQWLFQAPMEETIRSLQEKCTEIVEDSYSYLSRKIDFGTREQKLLKKVLKCILAAHDQRTDSGIKTFRNKTGTSRL